VFTRRLHTAEYLALLPCPPARPRSYVTVYADGPTRVLRFSDDRNLRSQEARNQIRDLAARLKQVRPRRCIPIGGLGQKNTASQARFN